MEEFKNQNMINIKIKPLENEIEKLLENEKIERLSNNKEKLIQTSKNIVNFYKPNYIS